MYTLAHTHTEAQTRVFRPHRPFTAPLSHIPPVCPCNMHRYQFVGSSCSGKTTAAKNLASILNLQHTELDNLHWKPDWESHPKDEFRQIVREAVRGEEWVVDGNYSVARDVVWERAPVTVVWLNYSLPTVLWRWAKRTFQRAILKHPCCNGNYETLWGVFFHREALIWWILSTWNRRNITMRKMMNGDAPPGITFIELKSPKELEVWLGELERKHKGQ